MTIHQRALQNLAAFLLTASLVPLFISPHIKFLELISIRWPCAIAFMIAGVYAWHMSEQTDFSKNDSDSPDGPIK